MMNITGETKNKDDKKDTKKDNLESEKILEQYKYLKADFENYKKMIEREKINLVKYANQDLVKQLLPIIDDFENALKNIDDKEQKKGITMIMDNMMKILKGNGLKPIECLGKKFDPYYHEVLVKEKSKKEKGTILEEIQKGYIFNNRVIRHSKVKVSE